jgi:hypothetical protein
MTEMRCKRYRRTHRARCGAAARPERGAMPQRALRGARSSGAARRARRSAAQRHHALAVRKPCGSAPVSSVQRRRHALKLFRSGSSARVCVADVARPRGRRVRAVAAQSPPPLLTPCQDASRRAARLRRRAGTAPRAAAAQSRACASLLRVRSAQRAHRGGASLALAARRVGRALGRHVTRDGDAACCAGGCAQRWFRCSRGVSCAI